jgi:hypothetical protein
MSGYDEWLTTTPEDKKHLPECGCLRCHAFHREEGIIEAECSSCDYERCEKCEGCETQGYLEDDQECPDCKGTGRIIF